MPLLANLDSLQQATLQQAQQPAVQAPASPDGTFFGGLPRLDQLTQTLRQDARQWQEGLGQPPQSAAPIQAPMNPVQTPTFPSTPQPTFAASIGKLSDWINPPAQQQQPSGAVVREVGSSSIGAPGRGAGQRTRYSPAQESDPGDLEAWTRAEAVRLKIDPDIAVRVANTEGGFADPTRQNMQGQPSYGPFQLYIGGPENPGLGDLALQHGIDPRNPRHARAGITFALEHAAQNGWGSWYGAAANGIGDWDGIRRREDAQSPASQSQDGAPQGVAQGGNWRETWGDNLTPDQIKETLALGLDWNAAIATCGIAAAVAFARANGRTPTFGEALELARATGEWNADVGMTRGSAGQVALLKRLGVDAHIAPLNPSVIDTELDRGMPVQINAYGNGGHFFVLSNYRDTPRGREYYFGNSTAILGAANRRTWFRLDELESLGVGRPSEMVVLGR